MAEKHWQEADQALSELRGEHLARTACAAQHKAESEDLASKVLVALLDSKSLTVPLEALFSVEGRNVVYVQHGSGFEARRVDVGAESDNQMRIS